MCLQSGLQAAAMLACLCCLILMMSKMKCDGASAEVISVRSGEAVQLSSNLTEAGLKHIHDVRWTHLFLSISLKNNVTTCHHGRCELLKDGSLRFSRVQTEDSGRYRLQLFDERGNRVQVKEFLLQVAPADSSSSVTVSVLCCFLLLLLFFIIIIFILMWRRRSQRTATGLVQDNIYVVMHSYHGNKRREESNAVPFNPVVSMETPNTEQVCAVEEDVYV